MLPSYSSNCKSCPSIPVAARVAPPIPVVSSPRIPLVAQVAHCIFQYLQLLTHSIFILALHERTHNASYRKIRKSLTLFIATYIVGVNDTKYLEDQNCFSCDSQVNWASSKVFSAHLQKKKVVIQSQILGLIYYSNLSLKIPLYFLRVSYGGFHLCVYRIARKNKRLILFPVTHFGFLTRSCRL